MNDIDPVKDWFCQCKAGARVVGCCAHVSSVIWHLGLTRHFEQPLPSRRDSKQSLFNATVPRQSTSYLLVLLQPATHYMSQRFG